MTADVHHLFQEPDGLECTRQDAHRAGHGCVYASSSADDRHATSEPYGDES